MTQKIILTNGKYKFYMDDQGILRCSRNGQGWRHFVGDNAVLALFRHAVELEERLEAAENSAFEKHEHD